MNPSTCKPGELYVVRTVDTGDREVYGMRIDPTSSLPWMVLDWRNDWHHDGEVTVIRRADQQPTDWETLRRAADPLARVSTYAANKCLLLARLLEAEHKAAQEKAAADARLTEAERVFKAAWIDAAVRGESGNLVLTGLRALADAGLLAEVES